MVGRDFSSFKKLFKSLHLPVFYVTISVAVTIANERGESNFAKLIAVFINSRLDKRYKTMKETGLM